MGTSGTWLSQCGLLNDSGTYAHIVSVLPTRYFLGRPDTEEEMHIEIEKGKMLIVRLMAVGPIVEGRAQRDVWFEVNGEVRL